MPTQSRVMLPKGHASSALTALLLVATTSAKILYAGVNSGESIKTWKVNQH